MYDYWAWLLQASLFGLEQEQGLLSSHERKEEVSVQILLQAYLGYLVRTPIIYSTDIDKLPTH